jgi:hypothetical protein
MNPVGPLTAQQGAIGEVFGDRKPPEFALARYRLAAACVGRIERAAGRWIALSSTRVC